MPRSPAASSRPRGEAVLRSVAEATVTLFDAEAASIALHDAASDRLVIRVAAGTAGEGAVGLAMGSSEGIVGYVFTTGQPLAVSDVAADPRFDRSAAEDDRVRPALDPRRAAGRRRRHDRRARGARPPRRRRVRAARHRARGGVRAPGDGRDPVEPGRAGRGRAAARDAGRPSRGDEARDVDEAIDAARSRPLDDGDGRACGRSPTPSRALAPRRRARSPWSSRSSTRSPAARRARRRGRSAGDRRPPRLERAVRRRPPRRPRAPRAVGPRGPRVGVRRRDGRAACGSRSWTPGVEGSHPAVGGRLVEQRRGRARRRRLAGRADARRRTSSATGRRARGSSTRSRPTRSSSPIRVLGGDNRGNGGGVRDRPRVGDRGVGGVDRQPVALLAQRRVLRPAPRARGRGLLPERAAGLGRQQPRRRELPVAVRGGRVGRRPRRAERGGLVLQPAAAGRVRRARAQRRRRLAGRRRG